MNPIYSGGLQPPRDTPAAIPPRWDTLSAPAGYLASASVRDAVNVALELGQPLLVVGEPGTGKTELAYSIAYDLGLDPPLVFHAKTTSVAKDLFYRYDALQHFRDAQFRKEEPRIDDYIRFEALGLAIIRSSGFSHTFLRSLDEVNRGVPVRSVVLVDEIDKAPRDLPNDVLNEIESLKFTVSEMGETFQADQMLRPIIVFTSNAESALPDAFLRRCIFCFIEFPDEHQLFEIVIRRLGQMDRGWVHQVIGHFQSIRSLPLYKRPATAEFLDWAILLKRMEVDLRPPFDSRTLELLQRSYSVLLKTKDDFLLVSKEMRHLDAERRRDS